MWRLANYRDLLSGSEGYAGFGTKELGHQGIRVAGDVVNTGIIEVPIGKPLGDILFHYRRRHARQKEI
jgi:NADH-quinone oxidoreductase subunit F